MSVPRDGAASGSPAFPSPLASCASADDLGGMSSRNAQLTGNKRKLDDDDGDMESDGGQRLEIDDQHILNELTKLKNDGKQYNLLSTSMEVKTLCNWHLTDLVKSTKLTFAHYYQRDHDAGWSEDQKSQYLVSVFAGRAFTPFVTNNLRAESRLIDGGHRLDTLTAFWKDEVPMHVDGQKIYYSQLPEADKDHFNERSVQVTEFKDLPLKLEVEYYMQLNAGLPFSLGERLYATRQFNPITKLAYEIVSHANFDDPADPIKRLCDVRMDGGEKSRGRKNEQLLVSYLVHQLMFRNRGDDIQTSMAEAFIEAVCKWNKDSAEAMAAFILQTGKTLDDRRHEVITLLQRIPQLYDAVKAEEISRQTDWRRLVLCVLGAAEIPQADLDPTTFAKFVAAAAKEPLTLAHRRGKRLQNNITSRGHLRKRDVADFVEAFSAFRTA